MATRPTFIDTRSRSHGPLDSGQSSFLKPLPSPRFHVAGDVPPELSPLDAFAAQSRLLAKQLEDSRSDGKRLSRLPPLSLQNSFDQPRPSFVRSISAHDGMFTTSEEETPLGGVQKTDAASQPFRPVSVHPRMSGIPFAGSGAPHSQKWDHDHEQPRGRRPGPNLDFGARREQSPTHLDSEVADRRPFNSPANLRGRPSVDSIQKPGQSPRRQPNPRDFDPRALAPPRSPFAQRTPSMRSISVEDSDDDYASMGASLLSQSRKFSSSSGLSTSPISPQTNAIPRSPSVSSDFSVGGNRLSRPAFNFSRPLSRASEFTPDGPVRQASSDSQPSFHTEDTAQTPVSLQSDDLTESSQSRAAPSYVYSRFSLPRGKIIQRDSNIAPESHQPAEFKWELPKIPQSNVQPYPSGHTSRPSTPPSRLSTSSLRKTSSTEPRESSSLSRPFNDQNPAVFLSPKFEEIHDASISSDRPSTSPSLAPSGSTVKARSQHSTAPSSDDSAEDHVAKGIECHERGSLNESTYHLRIAARQGHPTGMLLYALACRHGWGMRPNQREGVEWLRKAADCAIQEVSGDEDLLKEGRAVDVAAQKTRKAQFALSIYELGVSHMNGWGIEQDKVLALRCFEIAGAWGDGDALAEAGFCYAQGVGCKKDLKKSARFYRMAESRGISMVGNSWIHKSKYKEDGDGKATPEDSPEKKQGRSRARSMFGRKRPPVQT